MFSAKLTAELWSTTHNTQTCSYTLAWMYIHTYTCHAVKSTSYKLLYNYYELRWVINITLVFCLVGFYAGISSCKLVNFLSSLMLHCWVFMNHQITSKHMGNSHIYAYIIPQEKVAYTLVLFAFCAFLPISLLQHNFFCF